MAARKFLRFYVSTRPPAPSAVKHRKGCQCPEHHVVTVRAPDPQMALFKAAPRLGLEVPEPPAPPPPPPKRPKVDYRARLEAQRIETEKRVQEEMAALARAMVPSDEELRALAEQFGLRRRSR